MRRSAIGERLSGKRLVVGLVVLMALIGGTLAYSLYAYGRIEEARRLSVEKWRPVAEELGEEYLSIRGRLDSPESGQNPQLVAAIDTFLTAVDHRRQLEAARVVEDRYSRSAPIAPEEVDGSGGLREKVDAFNQSLLQEQKLLDSWAGKLLDVFFVFERPEPLRIAGWQG